MTGKRRGRPPKSEAITTAEVRPGMCPHCGYVFDHASKREERARVSPGDWSLCIACAGVLRFDAELRAVLPPAGAYEAFSLEQPERWERIERQRAAVRLLASVAPLRPVGGRA